MLITVDVEDHTAEGSPPRFEEALRPLLTMLDHRRITATFFVVGSLAHTWRDSLVKLVEAGHEVGLHGYSHSHLKDLGEHRFRDELARGSDTLAEITGKAPAGFRAPYFSMTKATPWASELIAAQGFRYSSSVLPAWNPQAGFSEAPRTPFLWPSGLVEFPVPVFGLGRWALPVLGGAYLRLLPSAALRLAERAGARRPAQWTYAHPYDFDVEEPYFRRPGQSALVARLLFFRRALMLPRVARLAGEGSTTLSDVSADPHFLSQLTLFEIER